ncbi:hypothetical protein AAGG74_13180 [Bacillus mexicanus]|uniref:hypothetical protein n=1 Tax=Bacillus TaxID=1386 RepID=UPI001389F442
MKTDEGFPTRPHINVAAIKTSPNAACSQRSCCLPEPGYTSPAVCRRGADTPFSKPGGAAFAFE